MNFLEETIEVIKKNGKSPDDVLWVGDSEYSTDWNNFAKLADIDYYKGFGSNKIATTIKVVGRDWWLERHEYDGSEWWEFKTIPTKGDHKELLKILNVEYNDKLCWDFK